MYTLYTYVAHGLPVSLTRKMGVWAENPSFATDTRSSSSTELGTEVLLCCKEGWADNAS